MSNFYAYLMCSQIGLVKCLLFSGFVWLVWFILWWISIFKVLFFSISLVKGTWILKSESHLFYNYNIGEFKIHESFVDAYYTRWDHIWRSGAGNKFHRSFEGCWRNIKVLSLCLSPSPSVCVCVHLYVCICMHVYLFVEVGGVWFVLSDMAYMDLTAWGL